METMLLVLASLAALALGVLSAYGCCIMLFALVRTHTGQRARPSTNAAAHPASS